MLNKKAKHRLILISYILGDFISVVLSCVFGFIIRNRYREIIANPVFSLAEFIIIALVIIFFNAIAGSYQVAKRSLNISDLLRTTIAAISSFSFCLIVAFIIDRHSILFGRRLLVVVYAFALIMMIYIRLAVRFASLIRFKFKAGGKYKTKMTTLVYGAGDAGTYFVENICCNTKSDFFPVVFLDDDPIKQSIKRHLGIPIVGGFDSLEKAINDFSVKKVVIASLEMKSERVKEVVLKARALGCEVERFGGTADLGESLEVKEINFEDLLRRGAVQLNREAIDSYIKGKTILVTGGVGSIGSEICRQVLAAGCNRLIILDINENGLFHFDNELRPRFGGRYELIVGSVRDKARIDEVMERYHPEVVLHAAAHKHVPMMEISPKEAIKNNVFGTMNVCTSAVEHNVQKFLLISTDKSVNPTNIMGASKRLAEMTVQMLDKKGETSCVAVRFGNVLGSNGSVVPLFEKQIKAGGPVTLTDPEIKRFFMTIPEAVSLVLEAGAMASGGEIFVLDMGEPVKIYDLACDLIKYFGKVPGKDIEIKITGLRPGEKLYEEISLAEEETFKTESDKIYVCKPIEKDPEMLMGELDALRKTLTKKEISPLFRKVKDLIPSFDHDM